MEKYRLLADSPYHGRLLKRLSAREQEMCRDFISATMHMDRDQFTMACNRWMVDQSERPKNIHIMAEIVLAVK